MSKVRITNDSLVTPKPHFVRVETLKDGKVVGVHDLLPDEGTEISIESGVTLSVSDVER